MDENTCRSRIKSNAFVPYTYLFVDTLPILLPWLRTARISTLNGISTIDEHVLLDCSFGLMAGFYLDPISKSSVLMSLVVLVGILGIALHPVQGSLMGKGLLLNSHHNDRPKPWDIHRRPNNYYHYDPVEESYWQPSEPTQDDDGEEPCVGLCYYRKLMNLESKMDGERRENEPMPEEIVFEELTTHKPCVGLCQYYRSLGIENPYEKRQVKRFALHSGGF
eukprot:TCALIF_06571-PA protein Name:"Protein of unknown function" AED:0.26 eAED:0.26 QI:0/0.75/0.8/0.8/0.75/0.8/5/430/220